MLAGLAPAGLMREYYPDYGPSCGDMCIKKNKSATSSFQRKKLTQTSSVEEVHRTKCLGGFGALLWLAVGSSLLPQSRSRL